MEQLLPVFLDLGLPGAIIAALAWAYWQKDKALQKSNEERIADNERLFETVGTLKEALRLLRGQHD